MFLLNQAVRRSRLSLSVHHLDYFLGLLSIVPVIRFASLSAYKWSVRRRFSPCVAISSEVSNRGWSFFRVFWNSKWYNNSRNNLSAQRGISDENLSKASRFELRSRWERELLFPKSFFPAPTCVSSFGFASSTSNDVKRNPFYCFNNSKPFYCKERKCFVVIICHSISISAVMGTTRLNSKRVERESDQSILVQRQGS